MMGWAPGRVKTECFACQVAAHPKLTSRVPAGLLYLVHYRRFARLGLDTWLARLVRVRIGAGSRW